MHSIYNLKRILVIFLAGFIFCKHEMNASTGTDSLKYLGHSFVELKTASGKVIYIDPYAVNAFSDSADVVLITHEHDDHNELTRIKQKSSCRVIRSADAIKGGNYQSFIIGDIKITAVAAYNFNHLKSECVGYVIEFDGIKIYHAGDTGKISEMSGLVNMNITYALLPMDGIYTMTPEEAAQASVMMKAKQDIPIHTMPPPDSYSDAIVGRFKSPNKLIVRPNSSILLDPNPSSIPYDSLYLGQTLPGSIPKLFAQGIISLPNRIENRISFSPDGKTCFFSIKGGTTYIAEFKNGKWTAPVLQSSKYGGEPFIALDGKKVYLNSTQAVNKVGASDISYVDKNDSLWSEPFSIGSPLNSSQGQWHACIVADGSIYFTSSSGPICKSKFDNGSYQKPEFLPFPINGFSGDTYGDPYVAPDESYIIFRSGRAGGYGGIDLYISYKKRDGSWTNPKNLGDRINTSGEEFSGDITPDGKYMTFGRGGDLYWVNTNFVDSLKLTNYVPYLKTQIPFLNANVDSLFNYLIPDNTFIDDDGNNTLTYSASLSDGSPLPSWLNFDSSAKTFSGTPLEAKVYNIKLTATDAANTTATCSTRITVKSPTGVEEDNNALPQKFELLQNYPNPFNPSTNISFSLPVDSRIKLNIYNINGQCIKTLIDKFQTKGDYTVSWDGTNDEGKTVSSGIYLYKLQNKNINLCRKMILLR